MTYRLAAASLLAFVAVTTSASAQSLGDLARQEEARRKAIKAPAKVYTNESIRGGAPAPTVPATAPAIPPAPSSAASGDVPGTSPRDAGTAKPVPPPAVDEAKGEAYWKKRIQAERDALSRAEIFAEALQSRINALSADFVARDDPAQRAVIATDRQKALAELERVRQEIAAHTKGIAAIQEEARRAGVPPGWLR